MEGTATHPRGFRRVYQAGMRDRDGHFMGGTEIMQLVPHLGKLYAVTSTMWDRPGTDPAVGAQILVLDHPERGWRVEHAFDTKPARMSLASVTFAVDRRGRVLDTPVTMLLAGPSDGQGAIAVWSRDEASRTWTRRMVATSARYTSIRCLYSYRDTVTGVDRVFAGTSPNGIYSGAYDPMEPGTVAWDDAPELSKYQNRPMAFAVCNGALHVAIKPHLYRRIDGAQPRWEVVYTLPEGVSLISCGLRGLTTIRHASGDGECMLAALEGEQARILQIDPRDGHRATVELDVLDFLERRGGQRLGYAIVAYNDMTPVPIPGGHGSALVLGLEATDSRDHHTRHPKDGWRPEGRYLVRYPDGRYQLCQISDPTEQPMPRLVSTRTIAVSPFDHETLYLGGYDPNSVPTHNTAWVYSAPIEVALAALAALGDLAPTA
jgi:hypothetical protein